MTDLTEDTVIPFAGWRGRILARLLQLPFVRFHRVQLGFVERPEQYQRFLVEVVGGRLATMPGKIGVFGAGEHTRVLFKAMPSLLERVHCLTDNNQALWQQERFGCPVLPPTQAAAECDVILLSTAVFQHVIRPDLRRKGFRGPIVAVDDVVPPSWFLAA